MKYKELTIVSKKTGVAVVNFFIDENNQIDISNLPDKYDTAELLNLLLKEGSVDIIETGFVDEEEHEEI